MLPSKATAWLLAAALAGSPHAILPRPAHAMQPAAAPSEEHLRCATGRLVIRQQPRVEGRVHEAFVETGTAFFIDSTGDMLTAAHVYFGVPPLREGWVERRTITFDNDTFELPPRQPDESHVQAHLDVVKFPTNLRPPCYLELGTSHGLRTGTALETLGYPNERPTAEQEHHTRRGYFQNGQLLDQGVFPDGRPMLRASFFGEEGMSGSPICTLTGDVIGVLLSKEHNGHSYVFAVPTEELSSIL